MQCSDIFFGAIDYKIDCFSAFIKLTFRKVFFNKSNQGSFRPSKNFREKYRVQVFINIFYDNDSGRIFCREYISGIRKRPKTNAENRI